MNPKLFRGCEGKEAGSLQDIDIGREMVLCRSEGMIRIFRELEVGFRTVCLGGFAIALA
jgi:hypothetical protein